MSRKDEIAAEMSELMPVFLMHMFPYVFQPIDVPPSQILALVCVVQRNGCSLSDLKNDMHVSAPTITGIVNRLERDGMLIRQASAEDRRVTNVKITKKGEGVVRQLRKNIQTRWGYILTRIPEDTAETLIQMLHRITEGFKNGSI